MPCLSLRKKLLDKVLFKYTRICFVNNALHVCVAEASVLIFNIKTSPLHVSNYFYINFHLLINTILLPTINFLKYNFKMDVLFTIYYLGQLKN
jgi:hypothetical protein